MIGSTVVARLTGMIRQVDNISVMSIVTLGGLTSTREPIRSLNRQPVLCAASRHTVVRD
jgi:hypothetical protein